MFLHTFFRSYSALICCYKKECTKLDFSPNRFGNFGIIRYVYLKIKRNFTNNTYNRINTYNRKLRVARAGPFDNVNCRTSLHKNIISYVRVLCIYNIDRTCTQ